jgi:hypothetical protein
VGNNIFFIYIVYKKLKRDIVYMYNVLGGAGVVVFRFSFSIVYGGRFVSL